MKHAYLAHYGVRGMRWGVRKDRSKSASSKPSGKSPKGMTDDELNKAVNRMNLERRYSQLLADKTTKTKSERAKAAVQKAIKEAAQEQTKAVANKAMKTALEIALSQGKKKSEGALSKAVDAVTDLKEQYG